MISFYDNYIYDFNFSLYICLNKYCELLIISIFIYIDTQAVGHGFEPRPDH